MANHTITIENGLNVWGPAPSNKWGAYNWNAFLWGEGTEDTQVEVIQLIENTLSLSNAVYFSFVKGISESLSLNGDMGSEVLSNGDWTYVFPDRATDAEDRDTATWTEDSEESTTWTETTGSDTTWS